jgi:Tfp pilus assembly protein PilP
VDALKLELFASCFIVLLLLSGCSKSKTKLDAHIDYERNQLSTKVESFLTPNLERR